MVGIRWVVSLSNYSNNMNNVEFEENKDLRNNINDSLIRTAPVGLSGFIIRHGWARNIKQANLILLIIALVSLLLMGFVFNRFVFSSDRSSVITAKDQARIKTIRGYIDQGLRGPALLQKIKEIK